MLFPFRNIMREENEGVAGEVVSELSMKSLTEIYADNLKCANSFMDMFFDEDLWLASVFLCIEFRRLKIFEEGVVIHHE